MFGLIGLITGGTIGMTGAGGALIAIPLFMSLLDSSLQDATILSLVAVSAAAAVNLVLEAKRPALRPALALSGLGSLSSALILPLKSYLPASVTAVLILVLVAAGLREVWGPRRNFSDKTAADPAPRALLLAGLLLGVITAVTGLGGGVLLLPMLLRITGQSFEAVIPTGLLTIFLVSAVTLGLQYSAASRLLSWSDLAVLLSGTSIAGLFSKTIMQRLNPGPRLRLRQVTFTLVAVLAAAGVITTMGG